MLVEEQILVWFLAAHGTKRGIFVKAAELKIVGPLNAPKRTKIPDRNLKYW